MQAWEIPIFIFIGYLASKFIQPFRRHLKLITIDVLLPAYIFFVAQSGINISHFYAFIIGMIASILGVITAYVLFRKSEYLKEAMILSSLGNCVVFGFPAIISLNLPIEIAVVYVQGHNLVALSLMPFLATLNKKNLKIGVINAIKNPLIIAFFLGLAISFTGIFSQIIEPAKYYLSYSFYILLIYFGSGIRKGAFSKKLTLGVSFSKMIVPSLFVIIAYIFGVNWDIISVSLLLSLTPPAILTNAIIAHYNLKEEESIFTTLVLTMVSLGIILLIGALY